MWLFYLHDGTVLGTTSQYQVAYIQEQYEPEIRVETYSDQLDWAIDQVDYVIE